MKTLTSLCLAVAVAVPAVAEEPARKDDKKGAKFDAAKLVGTWKIVSGMRAGEKVAKERLGGSVEITKDTITLNAGEGGTFVIPYKLDAKAKPVTIDMTIKSGPAGEGTSAKGVVGMQKGKLRLCYIPEAEKGPKGFRSTKENKAFLFVLEKVKK